MVRVLASQQCGPGSIPARCHMWVEFVVGSRPSYEGFSLGSPVILPPQKPTLQIPIRSGNIGRRAALRGIATANSYLFILFFIFYFLLTLRILKP